MILFATPTGSLAEKKDSGYVIFLNLPENHITGTPSLQQEATPQSIVLIPSDTWSGITGKRIRGTGHPPAPHAPAR